MIDLPKARELLKAAVETQGRDFVYLNEKGAVGCYYEPLDESPISVENDNRLRTGCLIGVALSLAGETFHLNLQHGKSTGIMQITQGLFDRISPGAVNYFQVAQFHQDNKNTWGYAYDKAEESLTETE